MYHTQKKDKIIQDYQRCIPYLTVLDRDFLEATGKSIEAKLEAKDREIASLHKELEENKDAFIETSSMYQNILERLQKLEEKQS
jgi:hypothetical protein